MTTTYATTTTLLSDDGETRERITFYVPDTGGYVKYLDRKGHERQLCARFQTMGDTLRATPATLKHVIQRAMRLARADNVRRGW